MTCQDCERLLTSDESSVEVDGHLAACADCRELAADLRANAEAFREIASMPLPSVRGAVLAQVRAQNTRRQIARWGWALAAAAAIVIGFFATRQATRSPAPQIAETPVVGQPIQAAAALPGGARRLESRRPAKSLAPQMESRRQQATRSPALQEALKIKMFTSDPDVVIYWLVEPKEGSY